MFSFRFLYGFYYGWCEIMQTKLNKYYDVHPTMLSSPYTVHSELFRKYHKRLTPLGHKIFSEFNFQGKKVLDYGCGSGLVSFGFASDVKSIDGYDNSFGMIETYNEKSKSLNLEHISGYLHDINIESIKNNSYDLVVTNMTMHHIKDINNFVISLKNSLNIDGHLYIADLVKEDGSFHSSGNDGVEHFGFDEDTLYKAFKLAGLIDIKYEIIQTIQKPNRIYPIFSISGKVS